MKTKPFDPAAYLDDEKALEGYLQDAFETGDIAFISDAFGVVARARGMTKVSKDTGLSRESLYKSLSEKGNPEFGTILKIMSSLGLKLSVAHKENNQIEA